MEDVHLSSIEAFISKEIKALFHKVRFQEQLLCFYTGSTCCCPIWNLYIAYLKNRRRKKRKRKKHVLGKEVADCFSAAVLVIEKCVTLGFQARVFVVFMSVCLAAPGVETKG